MIDRLVNPKADHPMYTRWGILSENESIGRGISTLNLIVQKSQDADEDAKRVPWTRLGSFRGSD